MEAKPSSKFLGSGITYSGLPTNVTTGRTPLKRYFLNNKYK
jgi:hypothetical protein